MLLKQTPIMELYVFLLWAMTLYWMQNDEILITVFVSVLLVGLHNLEKQTNCDYFDWYWNCDMYYNCAGINHFWMIILVMIEKYIKMIMVWFKK